MLNPGAETGKIEAGGGEATFARAVLDEGVGNADLQQGQRLGFGGEQLGDRCAGPAESDVFLDGHQCAVARGEGEHEILVQGLDEAHVDEQALGDLAPRIQHAEGEHCQAVCSGVSIDSSSGYVPGATTMLPSVHCLSVLPAPKSQRGLGRSTP